MNKENEDIPIAVPVVVNCNICFQPFNSNGISHIICTLLCGHIFGKSCLVQWFNSRSNNFSCPICRKSIVEMKTFEMVQLSRNELIKDYEDKIKELETEILNLRSMANNQNRMVQRVQQNRFELPTHAQNVRNSIVQRRRLRIISNQPTRQDLTTTTENHLTVSRSLTTNSNVTNNNRSDSNGLHHVNILNPVTDNDVQRYRMVTYPVIHNETADSSRTITYRLTFKNSFDFTGITDATYNDNILITAIRQEDPINHTLMYGLHIKNANNDVLYIPLSDKKIVAVQSITDPSVANVQRVVAVCNKAKFYNIIIDGSNCTMIKLFQGYIGRLEGSPIRTRLLHKPSSITFITPEKYAIGTKRGCLFVRNFDQNSTVWRDLNYYVNDRGTTLRGKDEPITMLHSISESALICSQHSCVCIFDETVGRVKLEEFSGSMLSIDYNKHSEVLTTISKISEIEVLLNVWKIRIVPENDRTIFSCEMTCTSSEMIYNYDGKVRELSTIAVNYQNCNLLTTLIIDRFSRSIYLKALDGSCDGNQIPIRSPATTIKVCIEKNKYYVNERENLKFLTVSKTDISVYKLSVEADQIST
uniref:RING-type domain-containing protein n=1 Tax=Parastrongyloides trichosuri TaxID=131310 RepID=A0A0N4ZRI4_PARTI